jgi:hypothetical protein
MTRYKYCGDINLDHGGYYFRAPEWKYGYADVVRVTPCSDAGGQQNAWWIERLTVNAPDNDDDLRQVLAVIGMTLDPKGRIIEEGRPHDAVARNSTVYVSCIVDACIAYGRYDIDSSTTVQIGKIADWDGAREPVEPDVTLRAGTSLERYVRREYLKG